MEPVDAFTVLCALTSADVDVDALAAAGLSSYDVQQLATNAYRYMQGNNADFDSLLLSHARYRNEVDSLSRQIRAGTATGDETYAYEQALTGLARAKAAFATYLDGLHSAATADLSQVQQDCLASIRANDEWRSTHNLEFLTVDRSEAEWVELRDALANERYAYDHNQHPDYYAQMLLNAARSDADVTTAASNHLAYRTHVQYAWDAAVFE